MARAVVATAFGGPEVLSVVEFEPAALAPGQVLIDVKAAGVNPIDFKLYRPSPTADPARLPVRLGFEVAGTVKQLGDGAQAIDGPLAIGDEIIAYPVAGGYATDVVASASNVVHKPLGTSFEEASGLMLAGATAVHALEVTKVIAGDTLLVHAASGGVGLMVVQLAKSAGARVIGTASEKNHAHLRRLGVEPVAYGSGLLERIRDLAPGGVDAAVDIAGTDESIATSLALVHDRDRIVSVIVWDKAHEAGLKVIGQGRWGDPGTEVRSAARPRLAHLFGEGKVRVFMAGTYPLPEAAAAHKALESGAAHGKIALLP